MSIDAKLIIEAMSKLFDEFAAGLFKQDVVQEVSRSIPIPTESATVGADVVADNWGGLFDGGDDSVEQRHDEPIFADNWGGLFEQPAQFQVERNLDTPAPKSCLTSTDPDALAGFAPTTSSSSSSAPTPAPAARAVDDENTTSIMPTRCSMQVHSSDVALIASPTSCGSSLGAKKQDAKVSVDLLASYDGSMQVLRYNTPTAPSLPSGIARLCVAIGGHKYVKVLDSMTTQSIVVFSPLFAYEFDKGKWPPPIHLDMRTQVQVLEGLASQGRVMPGLLIATVADVEPWPPPLKNKITLLTNTGQLYFSLGLSFCYGQDVVKQRPPWPPPLLCCQNSPTDTTQPCLRSWQSFICGLADGKLMQPWPPLVQCEMQIDGVHVRLKLWSFYSSFTMVVGISWLHRLNYSVSRCQLHHYCYSDMHLYTARNDSMVIVVVTKCRWLIQLSISWHAPALCCCIGDGLTITTRLQLRLWCSTSGAKGLFSDEPIQIPKYLEFPNAWYINGGSVRASRTFSLCWSYALAAIKVITSAHVLSQFYSSRIDLLQSVASDVKALGLCQLILQFKSLWLSPDWTWGSGCEDHGTFIQRTSAGLWPIIIEMFQLLPLFTCIPHGTSTTASMHLQTSLSLVISLNKCLMQYLSCEFSLEGYNKWLSLLVVGLSKVLTDTLFQSHHDTKLTKIWPCHVCFPDRRFIDNWCCCVLLTRCVHMATDIHVLSLQVPWDPGDLSFHTPIHWLEGKPNLKEGGMSVHCQVGLGG